MNEADIQRINELARKSKTVEGLTEAELAEQAAGLVYRIAPYFLLSQFVQQFRFWLHS